MGGWSLVRLISENCCWVGRPAIWGLTLSKAVSMDKLTRYLVDMGLMMLLFGSVREKLG